jgi:chromosome segregation ATPase
MSNVVDFKSPQQLRDELAQKSIENAELKAEINNIKAVKELLHVQLFDLEESLATISTIVARTQQNISNLKAKLQGD